MDVRIDLLKCSADLLGESPVWDDASGCLHWVDSIAPRIRRFDFASGREDAWDMPLPVGSIGLCDRPGHLIAGLKDGFYGIDLAGGAANLMGAPAGLGAACRLNDGKVDRQGRFVCGALVPHGDPDPGGLYRIDRRGVVETLETGVRIANTLSFSPEGRTMYFADSLRRAVWAYDYEPESGAVSNRRVLIDTAPLNSGTDGACVDSAGCLWVALVETGRIVRITPRGDVDRTIELAVEFPSCPAFGGDGLATLFVTSISDTGSGRMKGTRPESGRVSVITGLGASGLPEPRFALG